VNFAMPTRGRALTLFAASALFAGVNLAFFLVYRSGSESRRAALEARRDALKQSVVSDETEAERVSRQKSRLGGVTEAIEEFYGRRIGTERETLAPVVDEIHSILKETGVAAPQISYTTTAMPKLPLVQMNIAFTVRCDYGRFKQLLRAFEASSKWIVVREIGIGRDNDRPGAVQVQLNLVTYFVESAGSSAEAEPRAAVAARRSG
jgi:hypothetical protein